MLLFRALYRTIIFTKELLKNHFKGVKAKDPAFILNRNGFAESVAGEQNYLSSYRTTEPFSTTLSVEFELNLVFFLLFLVHTSKIIKTKKLNSCYECNQCWTDHQVDRW